MNLEYFDKIINKAPDGGSGRYVFIVGRYDLAMNIIGAGYQALCMDGETVSFDDFCAFIEKNEFKGTYMMDIVYVPCLARKRNKEIADFMKEKAYTVNDGGTLFYKREYLEKPEYGEELKEILKEFILRFEGSADGEKNLDYYHRFSENNKPVGTYDIRIVNRIMASVPFFMMFGVPYIYDNGVYLEDPDGIRLKAMIQEYVMPQFIKSSTISSIYQLLITQAGLSRQYYEINNHPKHWINFRNGWFDPVEQEMHDHDPKYYSVNQIPFDFDLKWLDAEPTGEITEEYLKTSIPDEADRKMFWQYLGYCMTVDTGFQKFLMIKGRGGTGKSVLVSIFQHIIGMRNMASISLQNLNQRFYATGLFGKLINACADIPGTALENVDVIKKAVGEDTLLYERKGMDATHFRSYAKLLFSANELPLNLDEKSNAYYRRLMILTMNTPPANKDMKLKDKVCVETPFIIAKAVKALIGLYEDGCFTESDRSRMCVEELHRAADTIKAFLDAKIESIPGRKIYRAKMYEAYNEYCEAEERSAHKKTSFFQLMEDKGYSLKRDKDGFYYDGVDFADGGFMSIEDYDEIPFR